MSEVQKSKPKLISNMKSIFTQIATKPLKIISTLTQTNHEKLQPQLQSTRNYIRLKSQENVIEVGNEEVEIAKEEKEYVGPQVYFGTGDPGIQSIIICNILENNFSLFEQIEMRRVCRLWNYNVKHVWAKAHSFVLTVKEKSIKSKLITDFNDPLMTFKYDHFDSPSMVGGFELSIGKNHWNRATIDLLGNLFRNIQHLIIFYELSCRFDSTDSTENMFYFYRKFPKVRSFSFIMPVVSTVSVDFLSQIFVMINDAQAQLHTLHIQLQSGLNPFFVVKNEHFHKTLSMLENFTLNCMVGNLGEMLKTMGKSLPANLSIQSLSINVLYENSLSPVSTLFEQNSKLSQIKRLELTGLSGSSLNLISCLFVYFKELECLYLWTNLDSNESIKFTTEWIQPLSKLPHLNELFLFNFEIQLLEDWAVEALPNISKLTIVLWNSLFKIIKEQYYDKNKIDRNQKIEPRLLYDQYLHSFAKQFPRVEHLTIRHYLTLNKHISSLCFIKFYHLKSLKLIDGMGNVSIFTS